jgi:hypothetical protein
MKITPTTLTLQQFFSVGNEQFLIPAYQRRYAWGQKQQRELFDDIRLLPDGDTHLLGTVLFLSATHSPDINQLELVDGQQRITTIMVLLSVLANRFETDDDEETTKEIRKLLQCKTVARKAHAKLLLGDLDRSDYELLIENGDTSEMENPHLAGAFTYFTDWIGKLSTDDLNRFHHKLMNSATLIRLDVGEAKNAYKLFETINNRGLRLRPTDIIKNFLLGHASTLGETTLDKVKDNWRKLIVALDGLESDDFFRQHLAGTLHRKVTAGRLVSEFKTFYLRTVKEAEGLTEYSTFAMRDDDEDEDAEDVAVDDSDESSGNATVTKVKLINFAMDLRKAAEIYATIRYANFKSNRINRHLRNLVRIKSFQVYTLLLDMFRRDLDEKAYVGLLKALEAFMMRRHICEKRTNELETIFSALTAANDDNFESTVLKTLREHTPDDDEFETAFATFPFVANVIDRARYALEMIEYRRIAHREEYYLADPDQLELEHIIPKGADSLAVKAKYGDWATYLGEGWQAKHKKYLHRIGNMTLIADELNVVASNNPFQAKRAEYKKSNIQLTKDLAKFSQFKFKTVDDRSKGLAALATKIWTV